MAVNRVNIILNWWISFLGTAFISSRYSRSITWASYSVNPEGCVGGNNYQKCHQLLKVYRGIKCWVWFLFYLLHFFFLIIFQQAVSIDLASSLEQPGNAWLGLLYYVFAALHPHIPQWELMVLCVWWEECFLIDIDDLPWIDGL